MSASLRSAWHAAWAGKSLGRVLLNDVIRMRCADLSGRVLDLAGGESPSYLRYLPPGIDLVRTNRTPVQNVAAVDFNRPLPYADESFDAVLLFNALYIAEDPHALMCEMRRILKHGGVACVTSPLILNEMPEPHDYARFTAEGLERIARGAGFSSIEIDRIGDRVSAALTLLQPFAPFRIMRAVLYPLAILGDRSIPRRVREAHPAPIGYFMRCAKE